MQQFGRNTPMAPRTQRIDPPEPIAHSQVPDLEVGRPRVVRRSPRCVEGHREADDVITERAMPSVPRKLSRYSLLCARFGQQDHQGDCPVQSERVLRSDTRQPDRLSRVSAGLGIQPPTQTRRESQNQIRVSSPHRRSERVGTRTNEYAPDDRPNHDAKSYRLQVAT